MRGGMSPSHLLVRKQTSVRPRHGTSCETAELGNHVPASFDGSARRASCISPSTFLFIPSANRRQTCPNPYFLVFPLTLQPEVPGPWGLPWQIILETLIRCPGAAPFHMDRGGFVIRELIRGILQGIRTSLLFEAGYNVYRVCFAMPLKPGGSDLWPAYTLGSIR